MSIFDSRMLRNNICNYVLKSVYLHSVNSNLFLTEDSILSGNEDVDEIVDFLQELCEGEVLRSVICDAMVQECFDVSQSDQELRRVDSEQSCSSFHFLSAICSYDSASNCYERESASFLDLLLDIVIKLDFPEKLVTFLLQLLPNQEYKVCTGMMHVFRWTI